MQPQALAIPMLPETLATQASSSPTLCSKSGVKANLPKISLGRMLLNRVLSCSNSCKPTSYSTLSFSINQSLEQTILPKHRYTILRLRPDASSLQVPAETSTLHGRMNLRIQPLISTSWRIFLQRTHGASLFSAMFLRPMEILLAVVGIMIRHFHSLIRF